MWNGSKTRAGCEREGEVTCSVVMVWLLEEAKKKKQRWEQNVKYDAVTFEE